MGVMLHVVVASDALVSHGCVKLSLKRDVYVYVSKIHARNVRECRFDRGVRPAKKIHL